MVMVAFLVAACGDGGTVTPDAKPLPMADAGCEPGPDAAPSGKALGDVSGTWAIIELSYAVVSAPLTSVQISRNLYTYDVTQTGADLTIVERPCDIQVDDEAGSESTRMLPTLWANIPATNRIGQLVQDKGGAYHFTTQMAYRTRGITMADIANDPMPDTDAGVADPRVEDWDMDGNPGITLLLTGILHGQAYVVQRDWNQYDAEQTSPDQIEGHTTWDSEQTYLGSDPPAIRILNVQASPDPDASKHKVLLVRVPAGSNCSYVVANQCQLFNGK